MVYSSEIAISWRLLRWCLCFPSVSIHDWESELPLNPRDIVPNAALPADSSVYADGLKAHRSVKTSARLVR